MATMLCSKEDLVRFMSLRGIIAFSDHDETGVEDDDVIDDARTRASEELIGELYPLYSEAGLATSALLKQWCMVISSYYLCTTRGNPVPDSLHQEYERLIRIPDGLIHRTKIGKFVLPGVARTNVNVPAWSNLTIDRRYRREKIRVIKSNSSPVETTIEQDVAPEIILDH